MRTKQSSNEKSLSTTSRFDNDFWPFSQNLFTSEAPSGKRDKPIRNRKSKLQRIILVPTLLNFCTICIIQKPRLVSKKNEEIAENRQVRKIGAAKIFVRRILKFVITCNPGHKWEIKPKQLKCSFVNQRIEHMSCNSRRPGPSKKVIK